MVFSKGNCLCNIHSIAYSRCKFMVTNRHHKHCKAFVSHQLIINVSTCNLDVWFHVNSAWFYRLHRHTITKINMNNAHSFGDKTGPVPIAFYLLDHLYQDFCSRYLKGPDLLRYHFALLKLVK
jgi:hypothetical protein